MADVLAVLDDDVRALALHFSKRVALADAVGPRGVVARDHEVLLAHAHGLAGEGRVSSSFALCIEAVAVQREDEALLWRLAGGHFFYRGSDMLTHGSFVLTHGSSMHALLICVRSCEQLCLLCAWLWARLLLGIAAPRRRRKVARHAELPERSSLPPWSYLAGEPRAFVNVGFGRQPKMN